MELTAADILGPGGRIAARLANYEHRPQQLEMAEAVARAIAGKRHLVAEAGTGQVAAYTIPWNSSLHAAGKTQYGEFQPLDVKPFRTAFVRDEQPPPQRQPPAPAP